MKEYLLDNFLQKAVLYKHNPSFLVLFHLLLEHQQMAVPEKHNPFLLSFRE